MTLWLKKCSLMESSSLINILSSISSANVVTMARAATGSGVSTWRMETSACGIKVGHWSHRCCGQRQSIRQGPTTYLVFVHQRHSVITGTRDFAWLPYTTKERWWGWSPTNLHSNMRSSTSESLANEIAPVRLKTQSLDLACGTTTARQGSIHTNQSTVSSILHPHPSPVSFFLLYLG